MRTFEEMHQIIARILRKTNPCGFGHPIKRNA